VDANEPICNIWTYAKSQTKKCVEIIAKNRENSNLEENPVIFYL
jgi:hypothetical protein